MYYIVNTLLLYLKIWALSVNACFSNIASNSLHFIFLYKKLNELHPKICHRFINDYFLPIVFYGWNL